MRVIIIFALTLLVCRVSAQVNNIYRSGGISQTVGAPTYRPGASGNIVAIDTVTGIWYISRDRFSVNWQNMGQRIEQISGCSAPAYTPNKMNSNIVINACSPPEMYYHVGAGVWEMLNSGGGGGTVSTNATIDGDGSGGDPLKIAQQSAATGQQLSWTGATWLPSWGNSHVFVTSGAAITTDVNIVLIGLLSSNITLGLPACNAANNNKVFEFKKNGLDTFGVTIDPSGSETFYDGSATKQIYNQLNLNCVCRFSGGIGTWFSTL